MEILKIEQVIVGNEVGPASSTEMKQEPELVPLQSYQDESLQCFQCFITFSNIKVKERHMKKFHGDQYKQQLQQKNTLFTCYKCDKCFFTSMALSQHQASHSREEKPFCCGYCRKEFFTFSELNKHRQEECTGCIKRQCPCRDCGALFPTPARLLNHRIAVHPECLVVVTDRKSYRCFKCSQSFQTEDDLLKHQEKFACNINRGVKSRDKIHGRKAKNAAPLVICKKIKKEGGEERKGYNDSATTEGCLSNGPQMELLIPCSEADCDLLFPSVDSLRAHKRQGHGPPNHKTYTCPECDQTYAQLEQLNTHVASVHHSGYTCTTCGKFFARESALITHQKAHTEGRELREQR